MNFFEFPRGESNTSDPETNYMFSLFGIPWGNNTTSPLSHTETAPNDLREMSNEISLTTELGINIDDFSCADFGDIDIDPTQSVETNNERVISFIINKIPWINPFTTPIMIGGDHFCSYSTIKAILKAREKILNEDEKDDEKVGVIIFDAHLDYYDSWNDGDKCEKYKHCTITKRIGELSGMNPSHIVVLGARDIDKPELDEANKDNLFYIRAFELNPDGQTTIINEKLSKIMNYFSFKNIQKVYISIDIDALDSSAVPGTGHPMPGGLSYRELWVALKILVDNFKIIGFDLVEVSPNLDTPSKITQITAVKIIAELMGFIHMKQKGLTLK